MEKQKVWAQHSSKGRNDGVPDGAVVDIGVSDGGEELVGAAETDGCGSPQSQSSKKHESKTVHTTGSSSPFNPASSVSPHVNGGAPSTMTRPLGFLT